MSTNFDRFDSPYHQAKFPDPQEAKVFARCAYTGLEIYEGELYIKTFDGHSLKYDIDVLMAYTNARSVIAGEGDY